MTKRTLFFATLRQPAMRLLRAALSDLKWEQGVTWQNLTVLMIDDYRPDGGAWVLTTDNHVSICYQPEDEHPDFLVFSYPM